MKIALIGASGQAGGRILKELSDRGHQITAIARNPDKIKMLPHVTPVQADVAQGTALASVLRDHDAVISAVHFSVTNPDDLLEAVRAAGVKLYLVVGGAVNFLKDGIGLGRFQELILIMFWHKKLLKWGLI